MGFLDGLQQRAAEQRRAYLAQIDASLPPGAPRVFVDQIPVQGPEEAAIAWYIGVVGLQPEDVYGMLPVQSNDITVAVQRIYRDRPEYAAGRARLAGH